MKKFNVIIADCPWIFSDQLKMDDVARGAAANYSLLTIDRLKQMPIKDICEPKGTVLALWVPSSLLQEGLDVMEAWGFQQKQTYIWVKTKKDVFKKLFGSVQKLFKDKSNLSLKDNIKNLLDSYNLEDLLAFGMGRLFRQTHEICLIGTNGSGIYKDLKNKSQRSVSFGENEGHSKKPNHLHDSLELMFPDSNKIEIFARRQTDGWLCLGNESPTSAGEDIFSSLNKLSKNLDQELIDSLKDKDKINELWKKLNV